MSYRDLILNSSQNAGCIRLSPASHCCQTRQVVYTNSAADVCVKPALVRAARISGGVGLREAEAPRFERFGWLDILDGGSESGDGFKNLAKSVEIHAITFCNFFDVGAAHREKLYSVGVGRLKCDFNVGDFASIAANFERQSVVAAEEVFSASHYCKFSAAQLLVNCVGYLHFHLQPLIPRRGAIVDCVIESLRALLVLSTTVRRLV